jgi:hypothetical protein
MTYNVHSLCHLADDVKRHGSLDSFSAFPFESNLRQLKRMLKNAVNPAAQICRRIAERRGAGILIDDALSANILKTDAHGNKIVRVHDTMYSTVHPNNVCIVEGVPNQIVDILNGPEDFQITCQQFDTSEDFWEIGVPSSHLLIFKCSKTLLPVCKTHAITSIDCKCVSFVQKNNLVVVPILHSHI